MEWTIDLANDTCDTIYSDTFSSVSAPLGAGTAPAPPTLWRLSYQRFKGLISIEPVLSREEMVSQAAQQVPNLAHAAELTAWTRRVTWTLALLALPTARACKETLPPLLLPATTPVDAPAPAPPAPPGAAPGVHTLVRSGKATLRPAARTVPALTLPEELLVYAAHRIAKAQDPKVAGLGLNTRRIAHRYATGGAVTVRVAVVSTDTARSVVEWRAQNLPRLLRPGILTGYAPSGTDLTHAAAAADAAGRLVPALGPARPKPTLRALPPGHPGLRNLGATCALNAVTQMLYHAGPFREAVLRAPTLTAGLPAEAAAKALDKTADDVREMAGRLISDPEYIQSVEVDADAAHALLPPSIAESLITSAPALVPAPGAAAVFALQRLFISMLGSPGASLEAPTPATTAAAATTYPLADALGLAAAGRLGEQRDAAELLSAVLDAAERLPGVRDTFHIGLEEYCGAPGDVARAICTCGLCARAYGLDDAVTLPKTTSTVPMLSVTASGNSTLSDAILSSLAPLPLGDGRVTQRRITRLPPVLMVAVDRTVVAGGSVHKTTHPLEFPKYLDMHEFCAPEVVTRDVALAARTGHCEASYSTSMAMRFDADADTSEGFDFSDVQSETSEPEEPNSWSTDETSLSTYTLATLFRGAGMVDGKRHHRAKRDPTGYTLVSVVVHQGTPYSGHYTCNAAVRGERTGKPQQQSVVRSQLDSIVQRAAATTVTPSHMDATGFFSTSTNNSSSSRPPSPPASLPPTAARPPLAAAAPTAALFSSAASFGTFQWHQFSDAAATELSARRATLGVFGAPAAAKRHPAVVTPHGAGCVSSIQPREGSDALSLAAKGGLHSDPSIPTATILCYVRNSDLSSMLRSTPGAAADLVAQVPARLRLAALVQHLHDRAALVRRFDTSATQQVLLASPNSVAAELSGPGFVSEDHTSSALRTTHYFRTIDLPGTVSLRSLVVDVHSSLVKQHNENAARARVVLASAGVGAHYTLDEKWSPLCHIDDEMAGDYSVALRKFVCRRNHTVRLSAPLPAAAVDHPLGSAPPWRGRTSQTIIAGTLTPPPLALTDFDHVLADQSLAQVGRPLAEPPTVTSTDYVTLVVKAYIPALGADGGRAAEALRCAGLVSLPAGLPFSSMAHVLCALYLLAADRAGMPSQAVHALAAPIRAGHLTLDLYEELSPLKIGPIAMRLSPAARNLRDGDIIVIQPEVLATIRRQDLLAAVLFAQAVPEQLSAVAAVGLVGEKSTLSFFIEDDDRPKPLTRKPTERAQRMNTSLFMRTAPNSSLTGLSPASSIDGVAPEPAAAATGSGAGAGAELVAVSEVACACAEAPELTEAAVLAAESSVRFAWAVNRLFAPALPLSAPALFVRHGALMPLIVMPLTDRLIEIAAEFAANEDVYQKLALAALPRPHPRPAAAAPAPAPAAPATSVGLRHAPAVLTGLPSPLGLFRRTTTTATTTTTSLVSTGGGRTAAQTMVRECLGAVVSAESYHLCVNNNNMASYENEDEDDDNDIFADDTATPTILPTLRLSVSWHTTLHDLQALVASSASLTGHSTLLYRAVLPEVGVTAAATITPSTGIAAPLFELLGQPSLTTLPRPLSATTTPETRIASVAEAAAAEAAGASRARSVSTIATCVGSSARSAAPADLTIGQALPDIRSAAVPGVRSSGIDSEVSPAFCLFYRRLRRAGKGDVHISAVWMGTGEAAPVADTALAVAANERTIGGLLRAARRLLHLGPGPLDGADLAPDAPHLRICRATLGGTVVSRVFDERLLASAPDLGAAAAALILDDISGIEPALIHAKISPDSALPLRYWRLELAPATPSDHNNALVVVHFAQMADTPTLVHHPVIITVTPSDTCHDILHSVGLRARGAADRRAGGGVAPGLSTRYQDLEFPSYEDVVFAPLVLLDAASGKHVGTVGDGSVLAQYGEELEQGKIALAVGLSSL